MVSTWGGFKRKIKGVLLGMIGAGISKIVFGLGRTPWVWIPAQFCSSFNFPLNGSSDTAIWLAKVAPNMQGRVFGTRSLLLQIGSAVAYLFPSLAILSLLFPFLSDLLSLRGRISVFGCYRCLRRWYIRNARSGRTNTLLSWR
jgi:MFS transporter, DHA3 family, macrolide efflux protein